MPIDPHSLDPHDQARLLRALARIENVVDRLGHPIDQGIKRAVAMLNELGVSTFGSCEGHRDWGTGGPYLDVCASSFARDYPLWRAAREKNDPAELATLRERFTADNAIEAQKLLPILDAFYSQRPSTCSARLTLRLYGPGIARVESLGVALLPADPAAKGQRLIEFQAEMDAFSNFLLTYRPAPELSSLPAKPREGRSNAAPSASSLGWG